MTDNASEDTPDSDLRLPPAATTGVDRAFAEQLVERARAEGVDLVGPGGLLGDLTKRVLEAGLEAEMTEHLGYERHAVEGRNGDNSRTGLFATICGPVSGEHQAANGQRLRLEGLTSSSRLCPSPDTARLGWARYRGPSGPCRASR